MALPQDAPWLGDFRSEILAFPYGRHDDQVDSISQFLAWAAEHQRRIHDVELMGKVAETNRKLRKPSNQIRSFVD